MAYKSIGGGWNKTFEKDGKEGRYISISLDIDLLDKMIKHALEGGHKKLNFSMFKNNYKKEDRHPDWQIPAPKWMTDEQASEQQAFEDDTPF